MKTTYTIAAIAMFAVILGMSALSPALAAKADKIWVCHFEEEEEVIDPETELPTGEIIPAHYAVIHISENGWNGHQNHVDPNGQSDFRDDPDNNEDVVRAECDVRNEALEATEPAPVEESTP